MVMVMVMVMAGSHRLTLSLTLTLSQADATREESAVPLLAMERNKARTVAGRGEKSPLSE